mmetsp:Transcript_9675/g.29317  ORF Transcript_9675/g.29317 Transcript_9675/m.29317 type:complete len:203 (-) Transcript_9675:621-1229(-)
MGGRCCCRRLQTGRLTSRRRGSRCCSARWLPVAITLRSSSCSTDGCGRNPRAAVPPRETSRSCTSCQSRRWRRLRPGVRSTHPHLRSSCSFRATRRARLGGEGAAASMALRPRLGCSGLSTAIGRMAFSSRRQSAQASTRASCACSLPRPSLLRSMAARWRWSPRLATSSCTTASAAASLSTPAPCASRLVSTAAALLHIPA